MDQLISSTKVIPDFPCYRISRNGQVWSCYKYKTNIPIDTWRELQPVIDKATGYPLVTLVHEGIRKNQFIHRLLGLAFIPNPENKPVINHIDGDKTNFNLVNLEWATVKENTQHAIKLGLYQPTDHVSSRCIQQLCKQSRKTIAQFPSLHEAGRVTGVAWQNIWKVCDGRRHSAGGFAWQYA